jgi:hypothetical protein
MAALSRFNPAWAVTVGVHGKEGAKLHQGQPEENDTPNAGGALGTTIAEIASEHELGLGVPERSFIRAYVDANAVQIGNDLRQAAKQIILGKLTNEQAATLIGLKHAAGIQKYISDGRVTPPLSAFTIGKKGSATPLLDTGQLRSAITHAVARLLA